LFHRAFGDKKDNNKKKTKNTTDKNNNKQQEHYIGRDWFPLAGSIGSDAQALPGGSRSALAFLHNSGRMVPRYSNLLNILL
jgi:hypothetical protein